MKRFISIFLILLIAFNAGGFFFVYFQLENYFKQIAFNKIEEYIPLDNLQLIKISTKSDDYYNEDVYERINSKEFSFHGKMFDIYQEDLSNDTLCLYCVSDENEDIIHNAFATYISHEKNDSKNTAVINIIKIFITIALPPSDINTIIFYSYRNNTIPSKISYQNNIVDVPSPPPRFYS